MKKYIYILLLFFIFSCNLNSKYEKKEIILNNYLKEVFDESIQKEKTMYILIPKISCKGCVYTFFNNINTITDTTKSEIIFITSSEDYYKKIKLFSNNILFDKNEIIDQINLDLSSITIFQTKEDRIIDIINYQIHFY